MRRSVQLLATAGSSKMQFKLLVLMTLCALAMGLPKDKRPQGAESESDESGERNDPDTTTVKLKSESKIIAIKNAADLETRIAEAGDNVVIIFFMVTWCPFCIKITPTIENIAAKTENLVVLQVDRDNLEKGDEDWNYGLSNLPSVPRFIFTKNGKKVEELSGSDSDLWGTLAKVMPPRKSSSKLSKHRSKSSKESSESSSKSSKESSDSSNSSEE